MYVAPEPTPIFVRVHTRVKNEKPSGGSQPKLPDKWAHFAMVLDCETTIDIRQDLNFLWWRFCELKENTYVCQQEGVVYADELDKASIELIRAYAQGLRADVEDGCPEDIEVESRTQFVDGKFWEALRAGASIVCFNAPFDLSRLALEYPKAQKEKHWLVDGVVEIPGGARQAQTKAQDQTQRFAIRIHQPSRWRSKQPCYLSWPIPRSFGSLLGSPK